MSDIVYNFAATSRLSTDFVGPVCHVLPCWHTDLMPLGSGATRFLHLADVAEILNISAKQTYALVRHGDLKAVKIGRRGAWRVEASELEAYIERLYSETQSFIEEHPFGEQTAGAEDTSGAEDG